MTGYVKRIAKYTRPDGVTVYELRTKNKIIIYAGPVPRRIARMLARSNRSRLQFNFDLNHYEELFWRIGK